MAGDRLAMQVNALCQLLLTGEFKPTWAGWIQVKWNMGCGLENPRTD